MLPPTPQADLPAAGPGPEASPAACAGHAAQGHCDCPVSLPPGVQMGTAAGCTQGDHPSSAGGGSLGEHVDPSPPRWPRLAMGSRSLSPGLSHRWALLAVPVARAPLPGGQLESPVVFSWPPFRKPCLDSRHLGSTAVTLLPAEVPWSPPALKATPAPTSRKEVFLPWSCNLKKSIKLGNFYSSLY